MTCDNLASLDFDDWQSPQPKVLIEDVLMADSDYSCNTWDTNREFLGSQFEPQVSSIPRKATFPIRRQQRSVKRRLVPRYEEGPWGDASNYGSPLATAFEDELFPDFMDPLALDSKQNGTGFDDSINNNLQAGDLSYEDSGLIQQDDWGQQLESEYLMSSCDDLLSLCDELLPAETGISSNQDRKMENPLNLEQTTPIHNTQPRIDDCSYGLSVDEGFYFDGNKFVPIKVIKDGTGSYRLVLPKSHPHSKGLPEDVPVFSASIQPD